MNVPLYIKKTEEAIALLQKKLAFINEHANLLSSLSEEVSVDYYQDNHIDFNYPNREDVLTLIKAFPGTWQKEKGEGRTLVYTRRSETGTIRLWRAKAPPTCRVVRREVYHPPIGGYTEVVEDLVCDLQDDKDPQPETEL